MLTTHTVQTGANPDNNSLRYMTVFTPTLDSLMTARRSRSANVSSASSSAASNRRARLALVVAFTPCLAMAASTNCFCFNRLPCKQGRHKQVMPDVGLVSHTTVHAHNEAITAH